MEAHPKGSFETPLFGQQTLLYPCRSRRVEKEIKMPICARCSENVDRVVMSFGKSICLKCRNNRPLKGKGNSGLYSTGQLHFAYDKNLHLERVPKSDGLFGKLFFEHYPQSKGIVGRSLNYLIMRDSKCLGIIGGASPPKGYKPFVAYFGVNQEKHFLNNNVFRLTESEKNLGTKVLRLFRRQIKKDYETKFCDKLIGFCTFIELPRDGALYKADNWDYLGITEGKRMYRRGENWEKSFVDGNKKLIFGYKFRKREVANTNG